MYCDKTFDSQHFRLQPVSAMVRELKARLGSAAFLLRDAQQNNSSALQAASRTHRLALLESLKSHGPHLSAADRADLMTLACEIPWHGDDKSAIIAALSAPVATKPKAPRSSMQDFHSITEFLTEDEWAVLLGKTSMIHKRDVLLARAAKLSARCPSEPSTKWFTALLRICNPGDTTSTTSESKADQHRSLKSAFKKMIRRMPKPSTYLEKLKQTPADLEAAHPQLYADAYAGYEGPVACKVDLRQVVSMDASWGPRGGSASSSSLPPPPPTLQLLGAAAEGNSGSVVNGLMQGFFQMAQSQERIMNMCFGTGQQDDRSSHRPLRSLAALADFDRSRPSSREPLLRLQHASASQPPLRPMVEEVEEAPIAMAIAAAAVEPAAVVPAAVAVKVEVVDSDEEANAVQVESTEHVPFSIALLDNLEKRDEEKRRTQAAKKAAEKAEKAAQKTAEKEAEKAEKTAEKAAEKAEKAAKKPTLPAAAKAAGEAKKAVGKAETAAKKPTLPAAKKAAGEAEKAVGKAEKAAVKPTLPAAVTPSPTKRPREVAVQKKPAARTGIAFWGVERSRSQVMARTGLGGPGSTKKFKYGIGKDFADEASAVAAADLWVRALNEQPIIAG